MGLTMQQKTLKAIAEGSIGFFKTEEEGTNILLLHTTDVTVIIPCMKAIAYVDTDKYKIDDATSLKVEKIVNSVFSCKVFGKSYKFSARCKEAPKHCMVITDVINGGDGDLVIDSDAKDIFSKYGYKLSEKEIKSSIASRDYSNLFKEHPEYKEMYDKIEQDFKEKGIEFDDSAPSELKVAFEAIKDGVADGLLLEGPTGTGKSTYVTSMCLKLGALCVPIPITGGTQVEDIMGKWVPNDSKDPDSPKWIFQEGPGLRAYYQGFCSGYEEVNFGISSVIAVINKLTDGTPYIEWEGKIYYRHPNFIACMTMNPGYKGTDELNVSLKNRFPKVNVPPLSKAMFAKWGVVYSKTLGHELPYEFFDKLYDFASTVERIGNSSQFHENVKFSIRNAQRLCGNILSKKRNFEEFKAAVCVQYLNDLSTDNDNSESLENFKGQPDINGKIEDLYKSYDLRNIVSVTVKSSFDDLYPEETEEEDETKSAKDALVEGLGESGAFSDI